MANKGFGAELSGFEKEGEVLCCTLYEVRELVCLLKNDLPN
jgi:hypothetical protein